MVQTSTSWKSSRQAFTLIELLVVIGIMTVLLALLLPTLRSAWKSARRTQCQQRLKQLGLAFLNYEGTHRVLPPGHIQIWPPQADSPSGGPPIQRTPWHSHILPQLGEEVVYGNCNFDLGLLGSSQAGIVANRTTHLTRLNQLLCPADKPQLQRFTTTPFARQKGNYVVNWGNTTWWQIDLPNNPYRPAPFGTNSSTRLSDILDGTSSTVLASELIMTGGRDFRGQPWNDDAGTSHFYTTTLPNSKSPDRILAPWCMSTGNPPSSNATGRDRSFVAARSFHDGGVNVVLCNGSARFVRDTINLELWRALGSIKENDQVTDF